MWGAGQIQSKPQPCIWTHLTDPSGAAQSFPWTHCVGWVHNSLLSLDAWGRCAPPTIHDDTILSTETDSKIGLLKLCALLSGLSASAFMDYWGYKDMFSSHHPSPFSWHNLQLDAPCEYMWYFILWKRFRSKSLLWVLADVKMYGSIASCLHGSTNILTVMLVNLQHKLEAMPWLTEETRPKWKLAMKN